MPYYTGSVNTLAALRSAIETACTANGWTADGNVLHKDDAYVDLTVDSDDLKILGGTGIDGSDLLTGAAPSYARIGVINAAAITFPATYHIHVLSGPDEVYVLLNYGVAFWQYLAFGLSDVEGILGTGCWFGASLPAATINSIFLTDSQAGHWPTQNGAIGLFLSNGYQGLAGTNAFIHHGMEGETWSGRDEGSHLANVADALSPAVPKYARQPNAWNSNAVLLEYQVYVEGADRKQALAADLAHARLVRVDNYPPGTVTTEGSESWKVYPWYRRDTDARDAGSNIQHTGTFGWAIRYDA